MYNEINSIAQQLFQKENFDQVSKEDLENFLLKYPYAAPARFLLAKKKHDANPDQVQEELVTAGLYFHNPLWLQWQMNNDENINRPGREENGGPRINDGEITSRQLKETDRHTNEIGAEDKTDDDSSMVFHSYHTIDYFASQGIRLQQAELAKDKLGQQLKSFTEWLRSMKKLPPGEGLTRPGAEDDSRQQVVMQSAASSIEEKEVVTETMAEVWAKQGNTEKAIEIYQKLSLQIPDKSAYFAAKIDQLK